MDVSLASALRIEPSSCVAFIGAGGKTTAMFKLARELQPGVVVTATTHLGAWQTGLADKHISAKANFLEGMDDGFQGVLLVTGELESDPRRPWLRRRKLVRWCQWATAPPNSMLPLPRQVMAAWISLPLSKHCKPERR